MNYKCFNKISVKKWETFKLQQKIKVFKDFFMEIEEILSKKLYPKTEQKIVLFEQFDLLKEEKDETMMKIYQVSECFDKSDSVENTLKKIYDKLRFIFNDEIINQKDFHFLPDISVIRGDKEKNTLKLPLILILDNLRSAFNVGSIIRTAECLNLEEIWFCGHTPKPDNLKVANTSMGTFKRIKWKSFLLTAEAIKSAKEEEYSVYALETVENAESVFKQDFISKCAVVLGNEVLGISEEILALCDKSLIIPVSGWKNSLNVATACAVTCFEIFRQWETHGIN